VLFKLFLVRNLVRNAPPLESLKVTDLLGKQHANCRRRHGRRLYHVGHMGWDGLAMYCLYCHGCYHVLPLQSGERQMGPYCKDEGHSTRCSGGSVRSFTALSVEISCKKQFVLLKDWIGLLSSYGVSLLPPWSLWCVLSIFQVPR
jgi:hypothetical protein